MRDNTSLPIGVGDVNPKYVDTKLAQPIISVGVKYDPASSDHLKLMWVLEMDLKQIPTSILPPKNVKFHFVIDVGFNSEGNMPEGAYHLELVSVDMGKAALRALSAHFIQPRLGSQAIWAQITFQALWFRAVEMIKGRLVFRLSQISYPSNYQLSYQAHITAFSQTADLQVHGQFVYNKLRSSPDGEVDHPQDEQVSNDIAGDDWESRPDSPLGMDVASEASSVNSEYEVVPSSQALGWDD